MAFYIIGIAALFMAGFLLLVVFGAKVYRNVSAGQAENNQTRSLLSYLSTCVKANDREGAVLVEESEFGPMLVIADHASGYGLRIYRYEGSLVEDYSALDSQLRPKEALELGETEVFSVEKVAEDTLSVTTDAGRVLLHTRSKGGAGG